MKSIKKTDTRKVQQRQQAPRQAKPVSTKPLIIWTAAIVALAFVVFSPCLTGEFLNWDDYNYFRDNVLIRELSWANIIHIFNYKTIVVGNYHPVTILSAVFEYRLVKLNPFLYHFDNLALHLCNIVLLSWLVWLLTKKTYATLIATALFALHPMRVESVVWAAERKDVLYTFFFLLSLVFYVHFLLKERRNIQYYILSITFFILSILSKGQAVVLPLILFLLDYWYSKKITFRSFLNKVPFLFFSIFSGILALIAQHSSLTEQRLMAHSFPERITIAAFNISAYIYKLVYPFNLNCFYKYPAANDLWWVYAGALVAILLMVVCVIYFRNNKPVVFGSLFFLFTISIVSQILPIGNAIIAERYTYVPYIGLFFIAGVLLDHVITGRRKSSRYFLYMFIALMAIFSIKTYAQSAIWHDNESLWKNAISQDPDNGLAYTNLGQQLLDKEDYPTAIDLFKKAIQNEATYTECFRAYQNLGVAYLNTHRDEEAIRTFSIALTRNPAFVDVIFNRGLAYTEIGKYDSAVADFTTILSKFDSLHVPAYYSRGIAFNKLNLGDLAIADYTTAVRIDPQYGSAYGNRGNIYYSRNLFDNAIADYNTALRINPDNGMTYLNRSFAYFKSNRFKEALEDALKAKDLKIEVHPKYINDLKDKVSSLSNPPG